MNYTLGTDLLGKMIQMELFNVNQKPTVADMDLVPSLSSALSGSFSTYIFSFHKNHTAESILGF